jgi:predicted transcriptional regulator
VREFGELEMAIMDVMWATHHPCVVREVRDRLDYNKPLAYTTVMTVMNILHRKGVLQRTKHGRAWRYWPVEGREEHDARVMNEVLGSGGDPVLTMRWFFRSVSDEEVRRWLEEVGDDEMERLRSVVLEVSSRRLAVS